MITKKTDLLHVLHNIYFKKNEPVSIVHFLTNRCNARCSFCFIDFDNPDTFKNELSLNEIDLLTKKARLSALQSLLKEQQINYNKSFVNQSIKVLFARY